MESMYNSPLFYYVMLIGFIAYGVYYIYNTAKYFKKNMDVRKQFRSVHKADEVREVNQYSWWAAAFLFFIAYCIFAACTINSDDVQAPWFRLAFIFVGLIIAGQLLIAIVKRRVLIADDGIAYEDCILRWQSILSLEPQKKLLVRAVDMLVGNGKHYTIPRGIGMVIHDEQLAWKKRKKNK